MKMRRNALALLAFSWAEIAVPITAGNKAPATAKSHYLMLVGTYTSKTESRGIYAFDYDATRGQLTAKGVAAETPDPSWLAIHPGGKFLYSVNEAGKNSKVSAFALDAKTGKLTLLNQVPALGEDPCYLSFDKAGKYVFVANYTSGNVVVFPIGADGKLGAATANVHDQGKLGPQKERQDGPHAHWVEPFSDNGSVYVADLGLDRVLHYAFDASKGILSNWPPNGKRPMGGPAKDASVKLPPATGPRHAVFSNDRARLYVLGELQSTVTGFHLFGLRHYVPTSFETVSALPKGFSGRNDAAEIALHPNGKFLYASNRGHDSIAAFQIDAASGKLTAAGDFSVLGKEPRHFAIDPAGNYLLAEDQLSSKIVTLRIDPKTGALTPTGDSAEVPSPVCLVFLPVE